MTITTTCCFGSSGEEYHGIILSHPPTPFSTLDHTIWSGQGGAIATLFTFECISDRWCPVISVAMRPDWTGVTSEVVFSRGGVVQVSGQFNWDVAQFFRGHVYGG